MADFPKALLEDIKARLLLSDIVRTRAGAILKRSGRGFKGLCPFHTERTPSFHVDDTKRRFQCFGCGMWGDVFTIAMHFDNLPFPDAVVKLAGEAGVSLPGPTPGMEQAWRRREKLYAVLEEAAEWFQQQLALPENKHALDNIARRGITADQIERFRLGYAPADGRLARDHLLSSGFDDNEILEAGVVKRSEKNTKAVFSPFQERVMFPITDQREQVVAFGGRILPEALRAPPRGNRSFTPAKYLNSTETKLFHKSRCLYGEPQARQLTGKDRPLVVVEGYTDVLACARAGYAAVAPLGTALSEQQVERLWHVIPGDQKEPVLCFDGDEAGERAALKACEMILPLLKPHHSARVAFLPRGEDPDTFLARHGVKAFGRVIEHARSLDDTIWHLHTKGKTFTTPDARAALKADLLRLCDTIKDDIVRPFYHDALKARLQFHPHTSHTIKTAFSAA